MAVIRSKKDAGSFMDQFEEKALLDEAGGKLFFVFADRERGGIWTLMSYRNGGWTVHGKGDAYCDEGETVMTKDEVQNFIWKHRAAINKALQAAA